MSIKPLKVPTTLDVSWAAYELGDVNQSGGGINLADTALLTKFLLGQQVPTSYQAYASDLLDPASAGAQTVDALDLAALLAKTALTTFKKNLGLPSIHPLVVSANATQTGLILAGNAGYGALPVTATADKPWISLRPLVTPNGLTTSAFSVSAAADAGQEGTVTLSFPNNVKRTVKVVALAPVADPNQVIGQYTATIQPNFAGLSFVQNRAGPLTLSAAAPVWDTASHVFSADVTVTNTGTLALPGVKALLRGPQPASLQVVNPSGYASDDAPFIEFGPLAPGASQTVKWKLSSPENLPGSFRVDLTSVPGSLGVSTAAPASFSAAADTVVSVRGTDIRAETAFFIESTKLVVKSWTATTAEVIVPAGFPAATYGVMAANPNGERAVLYPAFTVTPAPAPVALDPKTHARSFVDGYVTDVLTRKPIAGATVSVLGLSTTTTSDGYFLLRGVPQGHQSVRIDADGYERVYRFAEVQGEQQTVTLKLAELQPKSTAVTMIGAEGGTHTANDGSFIKIPAGALDQTVPIEFTQLTAANALPQLPQDGYFLAFARLGPVGLTFKKPATLYLPLQPGIVIPVGTPIRISYFDERQSQWVQDITGGVITKVNDRLFLQYEINHFTWIGGQWFPNPVKGCVKYLDGRPVIGELTNLGLTDSNGFVYGSTTRSSSLSKITMRLTNPKRFIKGLVPSVTIDYDPFAFGINDTVSLPCIVIPEHIEPEFNEIRNNIDNPCSVTPGSPGLVVDKTHSGINASQKLSSQALVLGNFDLIVSSSAKITPSIKISNFSSTDVDISKTTIILNNLDITNKVDLNFQIDSYTGEIALKIGAIELSSGINDVTYKFYSRSLGERTRTTRIYVVSRFSASNASVTVMQDAEIPPQIKTPIVARTEKSISYVFRQSEVINGAVQISIPITAYDSFGKIIDMSASWRFKLKGNNYLGSYDDGSAFVSGVANPTVSMAVSGTSSSLSLTDLVPDSFYGDGVFPSSVHSLSAGPSCGETGSF